MTGARYAAGTDVSVDRSVAELRRTIERYGAEGFAFAEEPGRASVMFLLGEPAPRRVRLTIVTPDQRARRFTETPTGRARTADQARAAWQQEVRARWRALALIVKAKLEAVAAGVAEFDTEFLGYLALPEGDTIGERMATDGALQTALEGSGGRPLLALPGGSS